MMRSLVFCTALLCCTTLPGCSLSDETAQMERVPRARAALREQRYYATLALLKDVDKERQASPETHLMRGLAFFKLEDYRAAVQSLEAAQLQSVTLQTYLAYLYLLLGEAAKAKALADTMESQDGRHPEIFILQGNISLKEQAYPDAQKHFRTALAIDNSSIKAYIGLANSYLLERQFLLAEENYLKAVFLTNQEIGPYFALVNYYIVTKRYEDAEQTARMATHTFPNNIDLRLVLSNVYTKMGKTAEALELLQQVLQSFPQSDMVKVRIIRQYFQLTRLEEAHQLIQSLLKRDSDGYYGLTLLGEYYLRKNDLERALVSFERVAGKVENSYTVNYYLGITHLMKNHTRLAIQFLKKSLENYPGFIPSHLALAYGYISLKDYTLSAGHANFVLQLDPGNVPAHLINGISLYFQSHLREAQYEFEAVQIFSPRNMMTPIFKSLIFLEQRNVEEVRSMVSGLDFQHVERLFLEIELFKIGAMNKELLEKQFESYLKGSPNSLLYFFIGNFYKEQKNLLKAAEYFQKALAADSNIVVAYYALAEIETRKGDKSAAIAHLQKAIDIEPAFVKAYRALGSLHEEAQDYAAAQMIYDQGLRYVPQDSTLLNNLGWIQLVHFADKAAAHALLRQALTLAPNDPDIQDSLGWWHYLNHDYQQAGTLLKGSVQAMPNNPLFRYHLGMTLLQTGDERVALSNLKKALELGIEGEYKTKILEAIR